MVGAYSVTVSNKYLKYEFTIKRNITVIKGNSATGKTTLIEMIREHNEMEDSGIALSCEKNCQVIYGKNWKSQLEQITDSIVFIDEAGRFTKTVEFVKAIQNTNNYYVIVSREKLSNLPYSIQEVYGIRESGKYAGLKGEYTLNQFYNIYGIQSGKQFSPEIVITEDSNAGFDFFDNICRESGKCCKSAKGKSNILHAIQCENENKKKLAIVDGAAFGPEMEAVVKYIEYVGENVELYAPESFEYIILASEIFDSQEIKKKLDETYNYADSEKYLSWERFYTEVLTLETEGTEKHYSKKTLNPFYMTMGTKKMILKHIPEELGLSTES